MFQVSKPKVLKDIKRKDEAGFGVRNPRLDLTPTPRFAPFKGALQKLISALVFIYFFIGLVSAPTISGQAITTGSSDTFPTLLAQASQTSGNSALVQEKTDLENQLQTLENQINNYENKVQAYQKTGSSLKGEINILNAKIQTLNLQIKALNLSLDELNKEIDDTQGKIEITQNQIDSAKESIKNLVLYLYQKDEANILEIFLKTPHLSNFFDDLNNTALVQDNLRQVVIRVGNLESQLENQKSELALAHSDMETIKIYRDSQKQATYQIKDEKTKVLAETKGQESKYRQLLNQTKETAAQIRKRIFQLLGGGELSFEEAYKYAKLAEGATGVRAALILAVLDRESAFGQNVGRCAYNQAMSPKEQNLFLQIVKALNIGPQTMTVSCPNRDGAYGGAMGPSQFLPSTWLLYSDRISAITGNPTPSPWNNSDAFVATALYLKDAGAGKSISGDRAAAAKYYAGSRWRYYLWTYGEAVVSRAQSFEQDISILNS